MALGENYVSTIIKRSAIFILVGCVISFFVFDNSIPYILGLILGGFANVLGLKVLEKSTIKAVNMPESKAKTHATVNYFIRYAIYGIVLIVAASTDYINLIAAIIAMFVVKVVIVTDSIYDTIRA